MEDDGVTLEIDFSSGGENVCKAAAGIVGATSECTDAKFKHKFAQS